MVSPSGGGTIAYEASNLTFNKTGYIDTGVYLFSSENINRDFELVCTGLYAPAYDSTGTFLCAKLDGPAYGFLVRVNNSTSNQYKGTIQCKVNYNNTVIVRRINGVLSLEGDGITNQPVSFNPNTVFDQPLVLGCALQSNGSPYRYAQGSIAHIIVTWL